MIETIATALLRVFLSKKLLILLVKTIAKSSENKVDDSLVKILEGALNNKLELAAEGAEEFIENVVPHVAAKIHAKHQKTLAGE